MAEQRSFVNSGSLAGLPMPTTREGDSIAKGDPASLESRETGRSISEPASLKIATPSVRADGRSKAKSILNKPPKEVATYRAFRRLCDDIFAELEMINGFFINDEVSDEGAEVVAEVEALLEELYTCPHGQGESLKRVVVAVQSQVNNVRWERRHIEFLGDVVRFLRVRYLVNEATVETCYDMMKARGLDPFRGTICEPRVLKRYRIEAVVENDESSGTTS